MTEQRTSSVPVTALRTGGVVRDDVVRIEPDGIRVWVASNSRDIGWHFIQQLNKEPGFTVLAGSLDDSTCLAEALERRPPDVLLLDEMHLSPVYSGSLEAILDHAGSARVLLRVDQANEQAAEVILRNGFHGLLLKTSSMESCSRAIRAVCRGDIWMPRALIATALGRWLNQRQALTRSVDLPGAGRRSLTPRERQIIGELKKGLSNKEIADELGVVEETVKKHLQHVYSKLGVRRRTSLLAGETPV